MSSARFLHTLELGPAPAEDAPLVVGIHGLCCSGRALRPALGPLAELGARVVLPDLLGHGRSPYPASAAYDVGTHLGALRASRAHAPPRRAWLVGVSLGALLALARAAEDPASVLGVVAVSAPLFASEAEARRDLAAGSPVARFVLETPALAERACRALCGPGGPAFRLVASKRGRPWVAAALRRLYRLELSGADGADGAELDARLLDALADTWLHSFESLDRTLRRCVLQQESARALARLEAHGVPVLFVHGARDELAPAANVRQAARAHGFGLELLDATHALSLTHASRLGARVAAFMAEAAPSARERLARPGETNSSLELRSDPASLR